MVFLERAIEKVNFGHITKVITQALLIFCGLTSETLFSKLICFGIDSVNVFQGTRTKIS